MREIIQRIQYNMWYNLGISLLAVVAAALFIYEFVRPDMRAETLAQILAFDLVVASIFLLDFFIGVATARKRGQYVRQNWLNFISSIPLSGEVWRIFRILRLARALRIVRVGVNAEQSIARGRRDAV